MDEYRRNTLNDLSHAASVGVLPLGSHHKFQPSTYFLRTISKEKEKEKEKRKRRRR
jgi:hypothetical protein